MQNPAPTNQAAVARANLYEVEVRLTALQKLQTLALGSALGLRADRMGEFTEQEIETLGRFQKAYDEKGIAWFRGKRVPSLIFELVALRSDDAGATTGGRPETSICVKGLSSDNQIKQFHEVMSKSAIRRLYSGMRLSYDKTLVQRPAREIDEEYDHLPSSLGDTLCGTRVSTRREGQSEWASTIGGLLEMGGNLYAVTSSHKPDDNDVASTTASLSNESSPSTLVGAEYDDDVEPALVLDLPYLEKSVDHGKTAATLGVAADTPSYFWPTLNTVDRTIEEGGDWRLIRVSSNHCLPNSLPRGTVTEYASAANKTTYITDLFDTKPSRTRVSVLAGFSGLCRGTLLSSPAFLSIHGTAPTQVWTVVLDDGTTLQKGDSGSWAVDDEGRWVGTVTAMSGWDAYLLPARLQIHQMQAQLGHPLSLPSPLKCYMQLAADESISEDLATSFATQALAPDVLVASASDVDPRVRRLALGLAIARTNPSVSATVLKNILRRRNFDLLSVLEESVGAQLELDGSPALDRLKSISYSMASRGLTGTRAEIQMALAGRIHVTEFGSGAGSITIGDTPGSPSNLNDPITAAVSSPEPEPTKEKPSKKLSWKPLATLPHGDEDIRKCFLHVTDERINSNRQYQYQTNGQATAGRGTTSSSTTSF